MGRSRQKKKNPKKRCWCKPTCGKQLSRTGQHKHYACAAKLGLLNQIAPSESESHSIASNIWTSDEASEKENHCTSKSFEFSGDPLQSDSIVVSDEDRNNDTARKHSNPVFVGKSDGNTTDSSYYSAVDSDASPSGSDGSNSGSDCVNPSLKDEEAQSESSSSPFDDEDITDEDLTNVERQGELFSARKSSLHARSQH